MTLDNVDTAKLSPDASYYAEGLREDGFPFRSELVKPLELKERLVSFLGLQEAPEQIRKLGATPADILIKYTNYSSHAFSLGQHGARLQKPFGQVTNYPDPTLQSNDGVEAIGAYQQGAWFAEGPADIILCWGRPEIHGFGVWIHFNFQMFGIGPSPVWYVTSTSGGNEWAPSGANPADPYTWPSVPGFKVTARPTAGKHSLIIDVVIDNQ
jgi:hypothetical protein